MFLSREYRARAIGLAVAYAVVITGLVIGGAFEPMRAEEAAASQLAKPVDRPELNAAKDPAFDPLKRCDTVC